MKNLLIITLIATLVGAVATPAKADREGRALVGGLIGGLIIGSIIDDHNDRHHHHHSRVDVRYRSGPRYDSCNCRGHYDYVSVKTWVNGHWSVHYDHCGNRYRDWRPGYYTYSKRKVWVPHNRGCSHYNSHSHHGYRDDRHYRRH